MTKLRPSHLPDFRNPPLNELVLGVQFVPPPAYRSINACEVWDLFRETYPKVQEQAPLPPSFETFGTPFQAQINFSFPGILSHPRYWFISEQGTQLLQFQSDRFLHNWRRTRGNDHYPRFEAIADSFASELRSLERKLSSFGKHNLGINQCEITYVNHIYKDNDGKEEPNPSDWLNFVSFSDTPSDVSFAFRQTLSNSKGKPFARLIVEANSAVDAEQRKLINFTLTVRGAPDGISIEDTLAFFRYGRETIVTAFKKLTTEKAHREWEIVG